MEIPETVPHQDAPLPNLPPAEVMEIFDTLRTCFRRLGFNPYECSATSFAGQTGVYLMAKRSEGKDLMFVEEDVWLRLQIGMTPAGQRATLDFKAGPVHWLEVAAAVPKPEDVPT
jgi:hypothetical protein